MQELNQIHFTKTTPKEKVHPAKGRETSNHSLANRYQKELQARLQQQEVLAELGRQALAKTPMDKLMDKAIIVVSQALNAEFGEILLRQSSDQELLRVASCGWKENVIGPARFDVNDFIQSDCTLLIDNPVIVDDLQTQEHFRDSYLQLQYGIVSGISVPLYDSKSTVGVLSVYSTRASQFTKEDASFLQVAANILAQAVERNQLKEAKRLSESRFQQIVNSDMVGVLFWNKNGEITDANRLFLNMIGYSREDLEAGRLRWEDITPPEYLHLDEAALKELEESGTCASFEKEYMKKDGSRISVLLGASVLDGYKDRGICFVLNTTEQHRAEKALRESEERLSLALKASGVGTWNWNVSDNTIKLDDYIQPLFGLNKGAYSGNYEDFLDTIHPDDRNLIKREFLNTIKKDTEYNTEHRVVWPDGSIHILASRGKVYRDKNGGALHMTGVCWDITEHKKAEEALRKSKERLDISQKVGKIGSFEWDIKAKRGVWSEELEALYGLQPGQYSGRYRDWEKLIHPEDLPTVLEDLNRSVKEGEFISEWRIILPNGNVRWLNARAKLFYDKAGNPLRIVGVNMDITEHKQAEAERRILEEQLLQSQKMESIGRLAGGVAHDFNNLLTAILGYSQLLQRRVGANDVLQTEISEVIKAAQRAENLTRQLLAFSRKQTLQPKVLDINYVITDLHKMLSRLIGEDIDLIMNLKPDLWRVKVDPGQIEQVIVNLVINARDAMPMGGKLSIATNHVTVEDNNTFKESGITRGNYIRVAIKDTGCGMDSNIKAHIFEPFFTTKESGKGTGLGLATVYGVVKQSGGHITVHSKVNHGTTFYIYLPSVEQRAETAPDTENTDSPLPGSETILLAEDDQFVRTLSARVLRDQGYTVIETTNGEDALKLVRENVDQVIHLLMTDMIMPRMGGKQLSEEIKRLRPDMKIIYTSGYVDTSLLDYGVLDADIPFLQKPFTPLTLARTVHEALGHK
jgi:two-component system cell cycle sensor histidine kinase/response regulator CckA